MSGQRKTLRWAVPRAYSRFVIESEVSRYFGQLTSALLRVGLPLYGLCVVGLLWATNALPTGILPSGFALKAILGIPVGLLLMTAVPVLPFWLGKFGQQKAKITRRCLYCGWESATLSQVIWYSFVDVEDFLGLRAVEIGYSIRRGHQRTIRMGLDPAITNEEEIAGYLAEVLPDKLIAGR